MERLKEGFILMVGVIAIVVVMLAAISLLVGLAALAANFPLIGVPLCLLAFFGLCVWAAGHP